MNYEQKYKQSLERARDLMTNQNPPAFDKHLIEMVFPELKENEDEKNIKDLIDELKCSLRAANCQNEACNGGHEKRIALLEWSINWLEKQGELDNNDTDILNRFCFYSYKDEPNILYLSELYVNKEQRNKGIGTNILKIADEVAANMKCNSIRLKTEIGSNAERLYRKNGYNSLKMEGNHIWLEKQSEQKQTWKPSIAQKIVIKELIEDKNTSNVHRVILRGMLDEFKQFTNNYKRETDNYETEDSSQT